MDIQELPFKEGCLERLKIDSYSFFIILSNVIQNNKEITNSDIIVVFYMFDRRAGF